MDVINKHSFYSGNEQEKEMKAAINKHDILVAQAGSFYFPEN